MRKALVALLVVAIPLAAAWAWSDSRRQPEDRASAATQRMAAAAGELDARFADLSRQTSNRCDLQATGIMRMSGARRLQGSCCSAMQRGAYRGQVRWLRRYRSEPSIPRDPYDISAGLAKRLLRDRAIRLTASQQSTYRRAMALSREKGPCCCRCWRWEAFRGLSYDLIAHRRWPARRVAMLIQALDGCGGSWPGARLERPA